MYVRLSNFSKSLESRRCESGVEHSQIAFDNFSSFFSVHEENIDQPWDSALNTPIIELKPDWIINNNSDDDKSEKQENLVINNHRCEIDKLAFNYI